MDNKRVLSPLTIWIRNRIRHNKNVIIIINGATGSGKTYSAISLAEEIAQVMETKFSSKENIDFNFSSLLKKMMLVKNRKPGTPFIFEEVGSVGSGSASREWQSKVNRFFFSFMQTSRHRRQILIMTCPSFAALDKGTRELCHVQLITKSIDYEHKISYLKPYILQTNLTTGKIYFKYLRFRGEGRRMKLKVVGFAYPSENVVKEYERMKHRFTARLNARIIEENKDANDLEHNKRHVYVTLDQVAKLKDKGLSNHNIAKLLNIATSSVSNKIRELKQIKDTKSEVNRGDGVGFEENTKAASPQLM